MTRSVPRGVGLGLRKPHLDEVARTRPPVPFWEVAPENVLGDGGRGASRIREILGRYPVITHGLSLSVGGFDPFDGHHLERLGAFLRATGSPWHSEHLCFTSVDGVSTHELLPLPFTWAAVRHVIARVRELKARLPVPLLLENITYYTQLGHGEMEEGAFITEVLEGADVGWLLDLNNVQVNGLNFGFDPMAWLEAMPLHRVVQMHVAGHQRRGGRVVDTHGAPVAEPGMNLLRRALARIGRPVPVLLERDNAIPPLSGLLAERSLLQGAYDQALAVHV